ncbi:MAG: DNA starvation/stationary phase protection protein [Propionibacteriaceae bacterium]|jgi:starvation-inducible DNA-binding protein|nr:DNA starvation/stationary phase protection protein [Propionibacteriaceae bacterium]
MGYSLAGLPQANADKVMELLQGCLSTYNDLSLVLKHAHWNVVGPSFIGVHEMIDPQVDFVRNSADEVAERIRTLGGVPDGRVSAIKKPLNYPLGRGLVSDHLKALDALYDEVIAANRKVIDETGELDAVSQDLIITQTGELEKFQWFLRAHLES